MIKRYEVVGDKYGDGTVKESETGQVVFYEDYANLRKEIDCLQAEVQRLNATAQPVSDGWVTVPRSLTAENGAKAALLGEFSVQQNITCHECLGEGCDDCSGQGNWTDSVPVDWTTIKEIWAKGVEHFLPAAPGGQD